MSEAIKHECGIVVLRLLKPLGYYQKKYGTWRYGLDKLYLLMEKQHNRGQDGAGVVGLKLDMKPGLKYMNRLRSNRLNPIQDIFERINEKHIDINKSNPELLNNPEFAKDNLDFAAELFLGHLRYGTFGGNNIEFVHPVLRVNNWRSRTLAVAGNFNLTNVDEMFKYLVDFGQHPKDVSDTVTALEMIGLHMDEENQLLFRNYKNNGYPNNEISELIERNIDLVKVLSEATTNWDGGYVIGGLLGHGDAFVARDPWGIRPAFYYHDDEIAVVTSERPVIQTALNVTADNIKELKPGAALIIRRNGKVSEDLIRVPKKKTPCSFERIYFSRGTDMDIYRERLRLGEYLVPSILDRIDNDLTNSVFSFIPNTAETAFYGVLKGLEDSLVETKKQMIADAGQDISDSELTAILNLRPRVEKIAVKDVKLRTFISQDDGRNDLVHHVYDITYGTINKNIDNLIVVDDSIVRGTTLSESILRILDRLCPKHIFIVSSAPQIRYPDCYGIDMTKLGDFVAFRAAIELLKERKMENIIDEVYEKCKSQQYLPKEEIINYVKHIYKPFTADEISDKIASIIKPNDINAELSIIFQSIESLHKAIPDHNGDWYFTGDYPTPGGNKVVNTSFINYIEGRNERSY
ncbi:MAG TPA: amidophosphoribosyltransferase [Bacteroidales bacterium]|nr:amidophosphoribosyltransferase [Bacteroidales bacterium]HXK82575.1 amidophosphoribosyltransferase [Bacteroidales bacterium]